VKLIPFGLGRFRRALRLALLGSRYFTTRKLLNLLHCEMEKQIRLSHPRSLPYVAIIDVTNTCNLQCPYCPTGRRRDGGRKKSLIDQSLVRQLVDEVGPYLISANLYNWGEPLLHPQIAALVRMFHDRRVMTLISSNLSIKNDRVLENLCTVGLDYLVVSVSGASQQVHKQYHRGGDVALMAANTRHIVAFREKHRLPGPIVEWKYLLFKHNRHEARAASDMARNCGVDVFRCVTGGGAPEAIVSAESKEKKQSVFDYCHQLWHTVVLNADGRIAPCCYLFDKTDDFAEYPGSTIRSARQSRRFVTGRKLFSRRAAKNLPQDLRHPCLKCVVVHAQPHLRRYLRMNPHAIQGHRTGAP